MKCILTLLAMLTLAIGAGCKDEAKPNPPKNSGGTRPAVPPTTGATGAAAELARRLETAYREDRVSAAAAAAQEAVAAPADPKLLGLAARALYRAGDFNAATQIVDAIEVAKADTPLLVTRARLARGRGKLTPAEQALDAARQLTPNDPEVLNELVYLRIDQHRNADAAEAAAALDGALAAARGYPTKRLQLINAGRAAFLKKAGDRPLNVIAQVGAQTMKRAPIEDFQRPWVVETKINGHGPYTLALDLVGGAELALEGKLAQDAGIEPLSEGQVLTLDGSRPAQWALTSLEIGAARLERVVTRVFDEPAQPDHRFDGKIGIGLFKDHRATLNYADGRFQIEPSAPIADIGPDHGVEPLLYVANHRPVFIVEIEGRRRPATLGAYICVTTISDELLLELFKESEIKPMDFPTPGVGTGTQQARFGGSEAIQIIKTQFCDYPNPLIVGLSMPFHEAMIDKLLGMHVDVIHSGDISSRMRQVIVDGPQHQLQVRWEVPASQPASQPASAPAASAAKPAVSDRPGS